MRSVSIVGIGQLPVKKVYDESLRQLGAKVALMALNDAGVDHVDALYVGNMLSDELQHQKHIAALIADEAGLWGIEALQIRAATAAGAAALRVGYLAIASGKVDVVLIVGVEKMTGGATPALAKALDSQLEVPDGATLISQNARIMKIYCKKHDPPPDALARFSVNAHANALHNTNALFRYRQITVDDVMRSRIITPPIRLLDCSPICEGAAAVVLAPTNSNLGRGQHSVKLVASEVATDRFRMADRKNPLNLEAAKISSKKVFEATPFSIDDVDLFEVHDAFSIMACLAMEAVGFAQPGEGWRLAADGEISLQGRIPICTLGGLKARGHPIGASAIYQTCEIVLQLTNRAGECQVPDAQVALMQSIGGVASTVITHLFAS
ncbi:MAG TPA: thiolase domain-containing protein [Patescibacteria group bacterium]|nr:thiolase domain-containing protein [Patescibacteria group bacterium]